jgi:hypothetical protein
MRESKGNLQPLQVGSLSVVYEEKFPRCHIAVPVLPSGNGAGYKSNPKFRDATADNHFCAVTNADARVYSATHSNNHAVT